MKIFYSWQTDTPSTIGKSFIRSALDDAVSAISARMDLDEADRPVVDQDTQGIMGSPAIAETIFEKIRNSAVVVVDVTLVGETPEGKRLINSNVAYELGYAHGHHGDQVLLAVMNTYYGHPDSLPFDLKHRRWPRKFDLAPDATKAQRRAARQILTKDLAEILGLYAAKQPPGKKNERTPSTANAATYWEDGEILAQKIQARRHNSEPLKLGYAKGQPLTYLRIWPDEPMEDLSGKELGSHQSPISIEPLLGMGSSHSHCRNKHGIITYSCDAEGIASATQVFRNREIWGTETYILRDKKDDFKVNFNFVPTTAFEKGMARSLNTYLDVAFNRLSYPSLVHVEAGLANVEGFYLAMPKIYSEEFWGPLFEDVSVRSTVTRDDPESVKVTLSKIFEKVFDGAGTERPRGLNDLP